MKHHPWSLTLLAIVGACAQLAACGGREVGGGRANGQRDERPAASAGAASIVDQFQTLLQETAAELKLTPRQQVLWESYQQKDNALMADQLTPEPSTARRLTALQQIDARAMTVRQRLAAIEDVAQAAASLYQALDAEQRQTADRRLAATVPPFYSGLISCVTIDAARERPGGQGAPPPR